jgi:hypothetical protein
VSTTNPRPMLIQDVGSLGVNSVQLNYIHLVADVNETVFLQKYIWIPHEKLVKFLYYQI